MKFRIYLQHPEGLLSLVKILRSPTGLVFTSISPSGGPDNHFTYHEDGLCFNHINGQRLMRSQRRPLSSFEGIETVCFLTLTLSAPMPRQKIRRQTDLPPNDIVVKRQGWFGVEVMISNNIIELEPTEDRLNSCLYINKERSPKVLIEVFDLKTKENTRHAVGCLPRYPSTAPIDILKDLNCIDLS